MSWEFKQLPDGCTVEEKSCRSPQISALTPACSLLAFSGGRGAPSARGVKLFLWPLGPPPPPGLQLEHFWAQGSPGWGTHSPSCKPFLHLCPWFPWAQEGPAVSAQTLPTSLPPPCQRPPHSLAVS